MKIVTILFLVLSLLFNRLLSGKSFDSQYLQGNDSLSVIEKVYIHTDRDSYFAGDDIWFKAYLIDALDHLLTDHSSNLHVELISPSLKIISGRIIRLDGGLGFGDFRLPDDIRSGRYKLRAYTNYMRNFDDKLFFTKEILVVNSADSVRIPERVINVEKKVHAGFFPEGGSLIDNVSSTVAFKALDNTGRGCNITGKVFSSRGGLITTFRSARNGMGSFQLKPLPGVKYYALCRGADSIYFRAELPASLPKGIIIGASKNQNNELMITVGTNPETLESLSEKDLLLNISIRNEVVNTISFRIRSADTSFVVPTEYLPDGIFIVTLTTRGGLPFSERLAYMEREAPSKLRIESDKHIYLKREPVTLRISLPGDPTTEREGNVSLSVVDETFTSIVYQYPTTISSWFLLESDVRGIVEGPSYYFDPSEPDRLKNLDLLLLTQGWRDFKWKYGSAYFQPENGFTISGRLRRDNSNKPLEDPRVTIAIFGSKDRLVKSVAVHPNGRFALSGIDLTGEATLIASGADKKDKPDGVLTLDSVAFDPAKISDSLFLVSVRAENKRNDLPSVYNINEALRKKYKLSDTISLQEVNVISERHKDPQTIKVESSRLRYDKPDNELKITEQMLGYNNILQLLKGKIPGLQVLGDTSISIRGFGSLSAIKKPLILIDGNQAAFRDLVDMPIYLIDRIDVLKSVYATNIYGFLGEGGVINLITRAGGQPSVYKPAAYSASLKISGYSDARIFYSPQHPADSRSDLGPDLRTTLYWNPDINLDGNNEVILNYYNGDKSSVIRVISEGITSTGIPVTGKIEYEIK